MGTRWCLVLGMLIISLLASTESAKADITDGIPDDFNSSYFPPGFLFGSATAAYQIEGKTNKHGRGPSIWDTFAHEFPERIADGSSGDVADDFYDYHTNDIQLMNETGFSAFRLSISWSRVVPSGRVREGVNEHGIRFYNKVIDEAIERGLEPFVTLFHWDLPQALEDKYGGFLSRDIVDDFKDYADLCFHRFGNRVKHWITINEPWTFSLYGYDQGTLAPGRCSSWVNRACQAGDSATEPYIVNHNLILAHATAVKLYRDKYKAKQNGVIGATKNSFWYEPYNASDPADREAAKRALDFMYGWFMDPLTYGQYPRSMQDLVGDRLPKFLDHEIELVKGSYDFLGFNYYTGYYASAKFTVDPDPNHISFSTDSHVNVTAYRDGKPIGKPTNVSWLYVYPEGIRYILNYTKDTYRDPIIYITENGIGESSENMSSQGKYDDPWRKEYYESHLWNVLGSINSYSVNVKGHFAWSFMDNYEWSSGYTTRFGLYYVDFKNDLIRIPKTSVSWYQKFLNVPSNPDQPSGNRKLALHKNNEDPSRNVIDA